MARGQSIAHFLCLLPHQRNAILLPSLTNYTWIFSPVFSGIGSFISKITGIIFSHQNISRIGDCLAAWSCRLLFISFVLGVRWHRAFCLLHYQSPQYPPFTFLTFPGMPPLKFQLVFVIALEHWSTAACIFLVVQNGTLLLIFLFSDLVCQLQS